MTDKKFTMHVIAYGAPKSDTGYVPRFAISDADSLPWVLEESADGSKKAQKYMESGLHLSEQIAYYMGDLDADRITFELLDVEKSTAEKDKLSSEAASQDFGWTEVHETPKARIESLIKGYLDDAGPVTKAFQKGYSKVTGEEILGSTLGDTIWWISMLTKEVRDGAKQVKERAERFEEDHEEGVAIATGVAWFAGVFFFYYGLGVLGRKVIIKSLNNWTENR